MRRPIPAVVALALTLTTSGHLAAQELRLGVRGGLTNSDVNFAGSFVDNTSSSAGFNVGVVLSALISRAVELQSGVVLSRKGFDGSGGIAGNLELNSTYIEIPMLFGVRIPGRLSPHLLAGPILAIESGCSLTTQGPSPQTDVDCDEVTDGPQTKGADFGLLFQGGLEYDLGRINVTGDVSYNLGLTDIAEVADNVDEVKNRVWYFSVGFMWPIGGSRVEETLPVN